MENIQPVHALSKTIGHDCIELAVSGGLALWVEYHFQLEGALSFLMQIVHSGELRLVQGTDAASEGLNLQRLGILIDLDLDLPWNPTCLEQRKGHIQIIGQIRDTVKILNMRYRDSVEDRPHELLSDRLEDIHGLFGQIPDVLEDVWIDISLAEVEEATKLIDGVKHQHPFDEKYSRVANIDWESCQTVLSSDERWAK